jgi:hypothetical protein
MKTPTKMAHPSAFKQIRYPFQPDQQTRLESKPEVTKPFETSLDLMTFSSSPSQTLSPKFNAIFTSPTSYEPATSFNFSSKDNKILFIVYGVYWHKAKESWTQVFKHRATCSLVELLQRGKVVQFCFEKARVVIHASPVQCSKKTEQEKNESEKRLFCGASMTFSFKWRLLRFCRLDQKFSGDFSPPLWLIVILRATRLEHKIWLA